MIFSLTVKQDDFKFAPGDLICLHSLLFTVKNKFGLPDVALLDIFDDTDTAEEEDILLFVWQESCWRPIQTCAWQYVTAFPMKVGVIKKTNVNG